MKSRVFTGSDTFELDYQVLRWREGNPKIKVLKQHPDQRLPLEFKPLRRSEVLVCDDAMWRRIDYDAVMAD
jgi:hypothetical protein